MRKDYMTRLERAARWRLPRQEAEEVIADYRDITADPEMLHGLGKPWDVIKPLTQPRPYRIWLAVFAVLAACVLLPGHSGFGVRSWEFYRLCFEQGYLHLGPVFALLGMVLALVWFRQSKDTPKTPLPKGIVIALTVLLIWIGLVFLFHWAILHDMDGFIAMWGMMEPVIGPRGRLVPRSVYISQWTMCLLPHIASFLALYWLVKARIRDRRWAAAYILTLAAIIISMETVAQTMSMDPTTPIEAGMRANLLKCSIITAVGLAGTGSALC